MGEEQERGVEAIDATSSRFRTREKDRGGKKTMVKVLYDHQIFQTQEVGGISRYFSELLTRADASTAELSLKFSCNRHLPYDDPRFRNIEPPTMAVDRFLGGVSFRGKGRLYDGLRRLQPTFDSADANRVYSLRQLTKGNFDVFHPTYYDPYFLTDLGDRPFVVTVFDMIHEVFPEFFFPFDPASQNKRLLCERASRIITISHTTKADLVRIFGVEEDRITVVHLASSLRSPLGDRGPWSAAPDRYILFTGNRTLYKNFLFFLRAIAGVLIEKPDLHLVCTGPPFTADELDYFVALGLGDRVVHIRANDEHLSGLYQRAEVFVFPSMYEGFGLPLLEAFACRCPAAVSDIAVFREVAGEAASYFHPKDANSIADSIRSILADQNLSDELREKGLERNRQFSWQQTFESTRMIYEEF
ncbi:MAG: glycosyltransferase family 1 protein [Thermoanaerobaculales bacterium]|nr:glycosyltransferase family 1 protein [Thermoanaerobaculales bacterium]